MRALIILFAIVCVLAFCAGLLLAFGTMDWRWLALSLLSFVILAGNART